MYPKDLSFALVFPLSAWISYGLFFSCSLLSGAIHFWKTGEIRYVHGILPQLLGKSAVWNDTLLLCTTLSLWVANLLLLYSLLSSCLWSSPGHSGGFHPASDFCFEGDHWNCPLLLYNCPVQILQRAITIATSCRAMPAGKEVGTSVWLLGKCGELVAGEFV